MNITLTIQAPELSKAIESLATSIQHLHGGVANPIGQPVAPQQSVQNIETAQTHTTALVMDSVQQTQQQQPVAPQYQQPVQNVVPEIPAQQQAAPQAVPTSAPSYTMDQIAVASTRLMEKGLRDELLQLLSSFGVQALTSLPQEQYGAFATKLREMGANI